jgi:hypothetical protein
MRSKKDPSLLPLGSASSSTGGNVISSSQSLLGMWPLPLPSPLAPRARSGDRPMGLFEARRRLPKARWTAQMIARRIAVFVNEVMAVRGFRRVDDETVIWTILRYVSSRSCETFHLLCFCVSACSTKLQFWGAALTHELHVQESLAMLALLRVAVMKVSSPSVGGVSFLRL